LDSEVIYSGKDSYPKDTRKKKEDGKPKIWFAEERTTENNKNTLNAP